ncbi:MAG: site-specific integrase [Planctomycetota bacterium]
MNPEESCHCGSARPCAEWIDLFDAYLGTTELSVATRKSYVSSARIGIRLMGLDAGSAVEWSELGDTHAAAWMQGARRSRWAASTRRARQHGLREFLAFLRNEGVHVPPVERRMVTPARLTEPTRYLGLEAAEALIAAARTPRDRALLRFLWETGALAHEATNTTWVQIDHAHMVIHFEEGPRGARSVPVSVGLLDELKRLRPRAARSADRVFPSRSGGALDRHRMYRLIGELGERAALSATPTPMDIRHGRAIRWLLLGRSGGWTAALLGHRSVNQMAAYRRLLTALDHDGVCIHVSGD